LYRPCNGLVLLQEFHYIECKDRMNKIATLLHSSMLCHLGRWQSEEKRWAARFEGCITSMQALKMDLQRKSQ